MKNKNTSLIGNIGSAARVLMDALPNIYKDNTGLDYYYTGDSSKDPLLRLGNDLFNNKAMTRSALNDIDNREFALINQIDNSNNASFARSASNLTDALNFEGPGFGRRFADNNIAALKGAASGTQYGGFPIGTIVGGVVGGLSNAASQIIGNKRMKRMQQEANTAYNYKIDSVENKYNTMMQDMLGQQFANYAAGGGYINKFAGGGYAESGDPYATTFNAGGTHEENPYGGVQAGIDPQGTPNVFEENEVVTKNLDNQDYAFSERINVRNDVLEKFNLPTVGRKKDGKVSWADYVKLQKENLDENPNDPIEVESFKEFNNRAIQACEYQKQLELAEAKREQIDNMSDDELIQYNQQEQAQQQQDLMAQEQMMAQQQPMMPEQQMIPDESAYEDGGQPSPEQRAMLQQMQQQGYACGGKVKNKYDFGGILGGVSAISSNIRRGMNQSNNNQQIYGKPYKPTFRDFFKGWANGAMGAGESFISGMLSDPDMFKNDMPINKNTTTDTTTNTNNKIDNVNGNEWWLESWYKTNPDSPFWFAYGGEVPYANDRKRGLDLGRNYYATSGVVNKNDPYYMGANTKAYLKGLVDPWKQYGYDTADEYLNMVNGWDDKTLADNWQLMISDFQNGKYRTNVNLATINKNLQTYNDILQHKDYNTMRKYMNDWNKVGAVTDYMARRFKPTESQPVVEVLPEPVTTTPVTPATQPDVPLTPPTAATPPSDDHITPLIPLFDFGIEPIPLTGKMKPVQANTQDVSPSSDGKNHLYDDYNNIANYLAVRTAADAVLPPKIDRSGLKYYQDAFNQLRNTSAPLIGGKVAPAYHDYSAELNQNRADSLAAMDYISDAYQSNPYLASQAIGNSVGAYNANAEKIRTSNYEQNYKERNLAQEFNNKIDQVNQASLSANNQLNAQIDAQRAEALRQIGNNIDSYNQLDQNNEIAARQNHYALMNNIANQKFNQTEALYTWLSRPLNLMFWNRYYGTPDNPASRSAFAQYRQTDPNISYEDFLKKFMFSYWLGNNNGVYKGDNAPQLSAKTPGEKEG